MTQAEAFKLGADLAAKAVNDALLTLSMLDKPLTEKQKYMFWTGWNRELGCD